MSNQTQQQQQQQNHLGACCNAPLVNKQNILANSGNDATISSSMRFSQISHSKCYVRMTYAEYLQKFSNVVNVNNPSNTSGLANSTIFKRHYV